MKKFTDKLKIYRYEATLGVVTVLVFAAYLAAYLSGVPMMVAG